MQPEEDEIPPFVITEVPPWECIYPLETPSDLVTKKTDKTGKMGDTKKASDLVYRYLKQCQNASVKDMKTVVQQLNNTVSEMRMATYAERSRMEEFLTQSEKNGEVLNQFLDLTTSLDRNTRIESRDALYGLVCCIRSNDKKHRQELSPFLMKCGVTYEAAKDLMNYNFCYRTDKLAGQLVLRALTILSYSTCESVESGLGCGALVKKAAYMYLDPDTNNPEAVLLATLIIDKVEPANKMHKMLFYPKFLEAAITRMQSSTFNEHKGSHSTRQDSDLFYGGNAFTYPLRGSLNIINILTRSDDYRCVLHDRLLEKESVSAFESVYSRGTTFERKEATEILRQMSQHRCDKHDNKQYLTLLLTQFVGLKINEIPSAIGGASRDAASTPATDVPIASCTLANQSIIFLTQMLKIPKEFIDHAFDRCFCDTCMTKRGDKEAYARGEPPQVYALPKGWYRIGLKLPPRATPLEVLEKWHVAYHGTDPGCILPILKTGDLLMPGDKAPDKDIKPAEGHFTEDRKPKGFKVKQVFVSPSMTYSGYETYAPVVKYKNPEQPKETLSAKVGFQVRIQPGKYKVDKETVGAERKIDKNFKNSELEWSTDIRGVIILTAIVVQIRNN